MGKLREIGIQPDILLCRSEKKIGKSAIEKIALFCNVRKEKVIQALDVETIYEIPKLFENQGLGSLILERLQLESKRKALSLWKEDVVEKIKNPKKEVRIAVVGKYIILQDAYKSIYKALHHGGIANDAKVIIESIDSEKVKEKGTASCFKNVNGILVPGGFGYRGIEGKIEAIKYARENKISYFGICLGMQTAVIEFARHVCSMKGANLTEFNKKTKYPVISLLEEQKDVKEKGGTMRLGAYKCNLKKKQKAIQYINVTA